MILLVAGILIGYFLQLSNDQLSNNEKDSVSQSKEEQPIIKEEQGIDETSEKDKSSVEKQEEQYDEAWCNTQLNEMIWPLGWICLLSDETSFAEAYHVAKGENIFQKENVRKLFVMESLLSDPNFTDQFVALEGENIVQLDYPTDETVSAYLPYDIFIENYKRFFDQGFSEKNDYIDYDNRRPGANGMRVEKINVKQAQYDEVAELYVATIELIYSERAQ